MELSWFRGGEVEKMEPDALAGGCSTPTVGVGLPISGMIPSFRLASSMGGQGVLIVSQCQEENFHHPNPISFLTWKDNRLFSRIKGNLV